MVLSEQETPIEVAVSQTKTKRGLPQHLVGINERRRAAGLPVGRPKGVPNKLTALVRGELMAVYEEIGGREGFVKWAKGHRTQFYNLLARAAPREREANSLGTGIVVNVGTAMGLKPVIEVQRDHDQPAE